MIIVREIITSSSQVINGDCLNALRVIPDNSVDLIITDPPYNLGKFMRNRGTNLRRMRENHFAYSGWDDLEFEEWSEQMDLFLAECHRVLKKRFPLHCPLAEKYLNMCIDSILNQTYKVLFEDNTTEEFTCNESKK